jgi:hypothetical protein
MAVQRLSPLAEKSGDLSTAERVVRAVQGSPGLTARIAGVFYLLSILTRMFVEIFVRNRFVVPGDAARTASNILAHEPLFRLGFIGDIIAFASYAVLTALLFELLKPVHRWTSRVAAFFSLIACSTQAVSSLFHMAALVLLDRAPYLNAFSGEQLQALALLCFRLRAICYHNIGLVFFGLYCFLIGLLIAKSTFLPRPIGVLMMLAGLSYVAFLSPPLVARLQPYILVFPGVGQIAFTLWLLLIGLNARKWRDQASGAVGILVQ